MPDSSSARDLLLLEVQPQAEGEDSVSASPAAVQESLWQGALYVDNPTTVKSASKPLPTEPS